MGKSSDAPQAPDTSAISNAQGANATNDNAISAEQLAWARAQGVANQGHADTAVNGALTQQDALNKQSATDLNTYNNTATPALQSLKRDADNYSNAGFKDQKVAAAQADVGRNFEAARNNSTQQLESYGVNPADTRFGALDIGTRVAEAAAKAAAGTNMGETVDATGRQLQQQVFTDASGVGAAGVNESNAGTNAGTAAVNNENSTLATNAAAQGTGTQYAGLSNAALTGQGQTVDNSYTNSLNQFKANQASSSGIGSAVGLAAGIGLKAAMAEHGGPITAIHAAVGGPAANPEATPGGAIPAGASPTRGQATDDVPARLTVGEFVMPKDVVAWKGQEHFQKLIDKSREQAAAATAKPAVGQAAPQRPTFSSTPQGAIPAQRAA